MNIQFNTHGTIDSSFHIENFWDERMPPYWLIKFMKMMVWIRDGRIASDFAVHRFMKEFYIFTIGKKMNNFWLLFYA